VSPAGEMAQECLRMSDPHPLSRAGSALTQFCTQRSIQISRARGEAVEAVPHGPHILAARTSRFGKDWSKEQALDAAFVFKKMQCGVFLESSSLCSLGGSARC